MPFGISLSVSLSPPLSPSLPPPSLSLNLQKISKKQAAKMQQDAAAMPIPSIHPISRSKKDAEKSKIKKRAIQHLNSDVSSREKKHLQCSSSFPVILLYPVAEVKNSRLFSWCSHANPGAGGRVYVQAATCRACSQADSL